MKNYIKYVAPIIGSAYLTLAACGPVTKEYKTTTEPADSTKVVLIDQRFKRDGLDKKIDTLYLNPVPETKVDSSTITYKMKPF